MASVGALGGFIASSFNSLGAALGGAAGGVTGRFIGNRFDQRTKRNLEQVEFNGNN